MKKKTKARVHAMMTSLLTKGPEFLRVGICNQEYADIEMLDTEEEDELIELMRRWP